MAIRQHTDVAEQFIHYIHYKHLCSASSRGTTQKHSEPQCSQITQIRVVEGMSES